MVVKKHELIANIYGMLAIKIGIVFVGVCIVVTGLILMLRG